MGVLLLKLLRIGYFFVFFPSYYVGHKPCCKWTKPTYPIYRVCQLGPRLTDGREEMSTSAIIAFFSADLQWWKLRSPFWTIHAAVPLVKAASSRNYMGKYMFFSVFAMPPDYLFQWMRPLLKVMMFLHHVDKVWHHFLRRTRQNGVTPHILMF